MRIGAHPPPTPGGKLGQRWDESSILVEQLVGFVVFEPSLERLQMFRFRREVGDRHLMRAKCPFDRLAVDRLRPTPTLGRLQHDHWPPRTPAEAVPASVALDALYLDNDSVECFGHEPVHL